MNYNYQIQLLLRSVTIKTSRYQNQPLSKSLTVKTHSG